MEEVSWGHLYGGQNPYKCPKDCPNRNAYCHGDCDNYSKFREFNETLRRKRKEEVLSNLFSSTTRRY